MKLAEMKEDLALQDINRMIKKPKISYNTIRNNTNLDKFMSKKQLEEGEEVKADSE